MHALSHQPLPNSTRAGTHACADDSLHLRHLQPPCSQEAQKATQRHAYTVEAGLNIQMKLNEMEAAKVWSSYYRPRVCFFARSLTLA